MLFDILESLRAALQSIRAHGFRSFLTTLGIPIQLFFVHIIYMSTKD
ncbi:MAG: hypothetical protein LBF16_14540 [Pseudomonadales bacterium]|jgi:hypothetical protein|nr:hypothetical protein [Pseudomonadales bacterium]